MLADNTAAAEKEVGTSSQWCSPQHPPYGVPVITLSSKHWKPLVIESIATLTR